MKIKSQQQILERQKERSTPVVEQGSLWEQGMIFGRASVEKFQTIMSYDFNQRTTT
ncbi:MAG: hypothetical protein Q8R26_00690 [bacterium]|nr:hypothetical protein [bacterium]